MDVEDVRSTASFLGADESFHVSDYIEDLGQEKSKPTVKQHRAAIRMHYDWLIVDQIVPSDPAHAVRGPKHIVREALSRAFPKPLLLRC